MPVKKTTDNRAFQCYHGFVVMRNRRAGKSQSFGNKKRNEVKRRIVYILGICIRLACLSIYGERGSLNRKYKASSPLLTLLAIPLRLWILVLYPLSIPIPYALCLPVPVGHVCVSYYILYHPGISLTPVDING